MSALVYPISFLDPVDQMKLQLSANRPVSGAVACSGTACGAPPVTVNYLKVELLAALNTSKAGGPVSGAVARSLGRPAVCPQLVGFRSMHQVTIWCI